MAVIPEEDVVKFEESKGVNAVARGSRANGSVDPDTDESDGEPSTVPPPKKVIRDIYLSFARHLQALTHSLPRRNPRPPGALWPF
jgi:hypothetical protein